MHDHYPSSGGDRDSKSADAAGCAMDQDPLFGRECRALDQTLPGGERGYRCDGRSASGPPRNIPA